MGVGKFSYITFAPNISQPASDFFGITFIVFPRLNFPALFLSWGKMEVPSFT